jgi:hypothetical protein
MSQHSKNYLIWVIKLINSLLMFSFRRSNQYHNRLFLNKKKMSSFFHIQRCSDQFWWKIDFELLLSNFAFIFWMFNESTFFFLTYKAFSFRAILRSTILKSTILINSEWEVVDSWWKVLMITSVNEELSEWWFWSNQKEEKHFFEDVNSIY